MPWSITKLECLPQSDGLADVVVKVFWSLSAASSETVEVYEGITEVMADPQNFTPYANLTEQMVLSWVWDKLSKTDTEMMVQNRLAQKVSPPFIDPPLPWT